MSLVSAKCPNCGASIQVDNERKEAFCSYCGSKVEVQEAIGKVKIDNSEELANLYQVARRAKEQNNSENAAKYYDMILVKDPNSWEATFYVVYYQAMQCKIAGITQAALSVKKNISPVLELIKKNVADVEEQKTAIEECSNKLFAIASTLFNAAENHFNNIEKNIQDKFVADYNSNALTSANIMYELGDALETVFGNAYSPVSVRAWKEGLAYTNRLLSHKWQIANVVGKAEVKAHIGIMNIYEAKVKAFDATFSVPKHSISDGCTWGGCLTIFIGLLLIGCIGNIIDSIQKHASWSVLLGNLLVAALLVLFFFWKFKKKRQ